MVGQQHTRTTTAQLAARDRARKAGYDDSESWHFIEGFRLHVEGWGKWMIGGHISGRNDPGEGFTCLVCGEQVQP